MRSLIKLTFNQKEIYPEIIYSKRKTIGIHITGEQNIKVKAPYFTSEKMIVKVLFEKKSWIEKTLLKLESQKEYHIKDFSEAEIKQYRKKAKEILFKKVELYGNYMGVTYNHIAIKDQKTCWGSCSKQGNLNFNWRLILMPEEILDYVVVHELAHLKQLNHSPAFWSLVESVIPDYKARRKWLKEQGAYYIRK
ncbi:MAG: M48 family metallopeptidase [Lachnospiraceae bacterium]|nr:M48 family metallopeptidase [Lachnospiraceae bacterium]